MARIRSIFFVALYILRGCAPSEKCVPSELNAEKAIKLASKLGNEECEKMYNRRPFSPDSYKATFEKGRWRWGHFDPAGIHGYSAEVSFAKNGASPKVEVFFSSDRLDPIREQLREESLFPRELIDPGLPRRQR